jgi:hypothetical protein
MTETTPSRLGNVIAIDDERIKSHLDRVVRGSVEETLNARCWMPRLTGYATPSAMSKSQDHTSAPTTFRSVPPGRH